MEKKILLTTSSDDRLWVLSKYTIPRILKLLNWKRDYMHFHDGTACKDLFPNFCQMDKIPLANPTNNVYRNIVEYLRKNTYDRWLHFDGDMFMGGYNPEKFIEYVIELDKVGTRLQHGMQVNLDTEGNPSFVEYDVLSSQLMYIDVTDAITKMDEYVLKKNVSWTYECALQTDFTIYPYMQMPGAMLCVHTHYPHDKSSGEDRLNRLSKFLTKYYRYAEYKYKDNIIYPWAKAEYDRMLNFRATLLGQMLAPYSNILITDEQERKQFIQPFGDAIKEQALLKEVSISPINQFFNTVYYINLDHRIDRRKRTEELFKQHNIKAVRFPAFYDKEHSVRACTRSHYEIIKLAKSQSLRNVLICEDDIEFTESFTRITEFLNDLKAVEWNMIFLYGGGTTTKITNALSLVERPPYCTHCYGINACFFDDLIKEIEQRKEDYSIDNIYRTMPCYGKYFVSACGLTYQRAGFSDIYQIQREQHT